MKASALPHLLTLIVSFLVSLLLDTTGHLSGQGHQLAMIAVGVAGLNTLVQTFKAQQSVLPVAEEALATLLSQHIPALTMTIGNELGKARLAFERYLTSNLNPPPPPAPPGASA